MPSESRRKKRKKTCGSKGGAARKPRLLLEELEPRVLLAGLPYVVPGSVGQPEVLRFRWVFRDAAFNNETGVYATEDAAGRVAGLFPGSPGYAAAALGRAQVLFPTGSRAGAQRDLTFAGGQYLAFYIVQNSSTAALLASNPSNNLPGRPLAFFSYVEANPDGFDHVRETSPDQFAFEDITGGGDQDFNDVIGRVDVVSSSPPVVQARLTHDTARGGETNDDGITSDPAVGGTVTSDEPVAAFQAWFGDADPANAADILPKLGADGRFAFDRRQLDQINGAPLLDGLHILHLRARNQAGRASATFDLAFTLDATPPPLTLDLAPTTDSPPVGDRRTTSSAVTLTGRTEADTPVVLSPGGASTTTAGADFRFDGVTLALGANDFTATAADVAGNETTVGLTVTRDPVVAMGGPPVIDAGLTNDTAPNGQTNTDGVTSDPAVGGTVTSDEPVASFRAGFDGSDPATFVDALTDLGADDSFAFGRARLEQINGGLLADGRHTLHLRASDRAGRMSALFDLPFTLDTTPPTVSIVSPAQGLLTNDNLTVAGLVADDLSGVASLQAAIDGGVYSATAFDASGAFSLVTALPLDHTADGSHTVHFVASDRAGNLSGLTDYSFTLEVCPPWELFGDWTVGQSGGTSSGRGSVDLPSCGAVLREGDSFNVTLSQSFIVPDQPSVLTFRYSGLSFDVASQGRVKDAFEAALVDSDGKPLVHTIAGGRDAFFNVSEGQPTVLGADAVADGQTVTVDLSALVPGQAATILFRLVNNDGDVNTTVRLDSVQVTPRSAATGPATVPLAAAGNQTAAPIDFNHLADVSGSVQGIYGRTSFNEDSQVLYADLSVMNAGLFPVHGPLLVGVAHISDPSVRLRGADGVTPAGIPYYDFTDLISADSLLPGQSSGSRNLAFYDPSRIPFTYDLLFLGQLNRPPAFTTEPDVEALVGRSYTYAAAAADPDGDALTFSLAAGPAGMSVDASSGRVTWVPAAGDRGAQDVTLRVEDGHGGSAEQHYVLSVIDAPHNRPPVFTSTPVVAASVDESYAYQATAADPDGDPLAYAVVSGPQGLTVDASTGLIRWTPQANQVGPDSVTLSVSDGRGGAATQTYIVQVAQTLGNHPPVIVSTPTTTAVLGQTYTYNVKAIDPDADPLTFSLDAKPVGMTIDPVSGLITWPVGDVTLSDGTFNNGDWTMTKVADATPDPSRSSGAEKQAESGGNPGSYGSISQSSDGPGNVSYAHLNPGATASPQASGGIGTISFSYDTKQQSIFPTLSFPYALAVGDLNGDGTPDLIVGPAAGAPGNSVSVLLNNGDGTFAPKADYVCGSNPAGVALGDLNGDGRLDLVTANFGDDSISVLLGNGDGTFGVRTNLSVGDQPQSVAVADVNEDGKLDIMVANSGDTSLGIPGSVSVLLGTGDGTFVPRADFAAAQGLTLAVADVNRDGHLDILTRDYYASLVSVFLGVGDGTFGARTDFAVGQAPVDIALRDLDGDGKLDIVTANRVAGSVSVLLGHGDGAFGPRTDYSTAANPPGAAGLAIGDVNGDGKLDLVTVNGPVLSIFPSSDSASVFLGNGDGTFRPGTGFSVGRIPGEAVLKDLDGDGRLDLVEANMHDDNVRVFYGNGDGTFAAHFVQVQPLLSQGDSYYVATKGSTTAGAVWSHFSSGPLTASDFQPVTGSGPLTPDFSA